MPVRSLNLSVFTWPDASTVDQAVRRWAEEVVRTRRDVERIGYFGSYARGDWGVGSDLDLIIIVKYSNLSFERRAIEWDATGLPVPVETLVYTEEEWRLLGQGGGRFYQTVMREVVWVWERE
ncbi:MAG: nucleotidyltransferase domain-containing protein [Deltaproteobacteria bacterium]|nr:nucleotidyltransferase domain-containing protein [Deltaproteobacteria bacterium]